METGSFVSPYLDLLINRIDLDQVPFSERGARLTVFFRAGHLSVRLAERWGQLLEYRRRPPLIDRWFFTDPEDLPLDVTLTTYPQRIDCATRLGTFTLSFADTETLLVSLPPVACGIRFNASVDEARADRRGGILRLTGTIRRGVAYTTNARILHNEITRLVPGGQAVRLLVDASGSEKALLLNITPRLGFNRSVPDPSRALEGAARRWHDWFAAAPPVEERYRAQYYYAWWVMRAGLVSSRDYTTREALLPSPTHYVGVWQWDAYFHALAYRHVDMQLAQDQIRIVLDHQREDGMLPDAVHDEGLVTHLSTPVEGDVTKPPLLGWAAWKLYEHGGDREFLDEIYEPIVRWNNWWFEHNDLDGNGLCEYRHPYSSGLDDSPLWDAGMPVESPDLNTYLYLQQEALSNIARVLGATADAQRWQQRAQALAQRLVQLAWDAESGLFWARHQGARIDVLTPFSLFPLITGQMPAEIAARLVAHLTDESRFWPRYPVPTVALDDPRYDPQRMWRGPTWVNINYLLIEGLQRSGYPDLARELRSRTLDLINQQDGIYEYYRPASGEPAPRAAPAFGWSAALFIDLAIQAAQENLPHRHRA
jgi:hypothetical protein